MAICSYCGKYHDMFEWPEQYRPFYSPKTCFSCYCEDPSRGVMFPGAEQVLPEAKPALSVDEEINEDSQTKQIEIDASDDIFEDDDGCQTEDNDNEGDNDYEED